MRIALVFVLGLAISWFAMTEIVYQVKVRGVAPRIAPPPAGTLPGVVRKVAWVAEGETGEIRMKPSFLGWFPVQFFGFAMSGLKGHRKWSTAGYSVASSAARNAVLQDTGSSRRNLRYQEERLLVTYWITRHWTADQALMATVGKSWYGCGIYDLDTASRTFLGKPVDSLDLPQAVAMMAYWRNPERYRKDSASFKLSFESLQDKVIENFPELASQDGSMPRLVSRACHEGSLGP